MNFAKDEPVILGGLLSGLGVFLGIRYGAHVDGATQIFPGVSVASFVAFLSRFVGPSAVSDVRGIANDVESLKLQLAPLEKARGWQSAVAWLHGHGAEVVSIVEAGKADVEDLLHEPGPVQPAAPHVPTVDAVADLAKLVPASPVEQAAPAPAAVPVAAPTPGA